MKKDTKFNSSVEAPAKLLKESQAADFLQYSTRALQNWRCRGGGPKYIRVSSRSVRYRLVDLIEWTASRIRSNTSEKS